MIVRLFIMGRWSVAKPQKDITAYEAAQLAVFFTVVSRLLCSEEQKNKFIEEHGLQRHFEPEPAPAAK